VSRGELLPGISRSFDRIDVVDAAAFSILTSPTRPLRSGEPKQRRGVP
jgi:hypothetical protein